jgi:wyosine [tRNA(Phe)-imidazoG37] synthetase (radical SAM superfamily)
MILAGAIGVQMETAALQQKSVIVWQKPCSAPRYLLPYCSQMAKILHQPGARESGRTLTSRAPARPIVPDEAAYEYPRDFLQNEFVYLVISPRARGLSIGVNVNPAVKCNFHCLYCEIDRARPARVDRFDVKRLAAELHDTFGLAHSGRLRQCPRYANLPDDLLQLRHVALSGDGEPTLSSHFLDALQAMVHLRAKGGMPFFKIVVVTNSTALDRPKVLRGLKLLTRTDEIWAKLDGGTQDYLNRLNGATIPLEKIMANILLVARQRPVVIQSLFPAINGAPPPAREIRQYARRLKELKEAGAEIPLVQIYSATRPMVRTGCTHLPLKSLSQIAKTVRRVAGLRAEVF